MRTTIWRAMDPERYYTGEGSCWAEDEHTARAYQDNPGFGGRGLYRAEGELGQVLDLTEEHTHPMTLLAELVAAHLGEDQEELYDRLRRLYVWDYEAIESEPEIIAALRAQCWDWVRYLDTYPNGAPVLMRIATEPLEAELVEIRPEGVRVWRYDGKVLCQHCAREWDAEDVDYIDEPEVYCDECGEEVAQ